jgi:flavin-dependent dehydrogenase
MIRSKSDILIVGGGPSGLALAARLKREECSVRVLERENCRGIPRHSYHPGYRIRDSAVNL